MKTIVFRKKRLVYLLLLIVVFLFVVNVHSTTVYASTMTNPIIAATPLTEMDDLELVNFAMQNGIEVPEDLIDSVEFGSAIKDIIQASPRSSYSFTITQDLAEKIQVLIDMYQINSQVFLQGGMLQSDQPSIMSAASHTLENNLVMHNGSWSSTGGDWSSSYLNYNCYSFAIDKTNERYRYPGQHSGVSMVYNYMSLYSISQMATFVKNDLDALGGYGDVSVYSSEPSNIQFWQTLICIRKGSSDYHFMKYDKSSQAWHHKPGGTAPLKYLHHPEDIIWVSEYSSNGVCYNADDQLAMGYSLTTYTSEVYYIVYGEHPFTTNTAGLPSNQIAISGVKSSVTLTESITIPEFLNSRTVTKIGSNAFSGQTQLSKITIPESVANLGNNAFSINTQVDWLGNYSFKNNKYIKLLDNQASHIAIPTEIAGRPITKIGSYAFNGSNAITTITVPNTITHVDSNAFNTTRNIVILLTGRTIVPTTFDVRWNSSKHPVSFNGQQCPHTNTTITDLGYNHGQLCDRCRTLISTDSHTYSSHTWLDMRYHRSLCSGCGKREARGHVVSSFNPNTCVDCGGPADTGFVILKNSLITQNVAYYFGNGSYILNNGIVVLSDSDLIKYYNGTLVLPHCCDSLDCDDHCQDCIDCDHDSHESKIDDSIYLYFDRRGFNYNYYLNRKDEDFFKRQ